MSNGYYVCRIENGKVAALSGPYLRVGQAAEVVDHQPEPGQYCTYSRYMLAKERHYPLGKAGDEKLAADMTLGNRLVT